MSATATDFIDFIRALEHVLPDRVSPATRRLLSQARCEDYIGNHVGVLRIMAKAQKKLARELHIPAGPRRAAVVKKYATAQQAWAARVGMVEIEEMRS
jgi:hypothetical protein